VKVDYQVVCRFCAEAIPPGEDVRVTASKFNEFDFEGVTSPFTRMAHPSCVAVYQAERIAKAKARRRRGSQ
jgi:hypothetical protein